MLSQSKIFYENNIICWYQIRPKVVWNVVHRLMSRITRTQTKTLPLRKLRVCLSKQKACDSHPVIAAILDAILNILNAEKQQHAIQILQIQQLLKTIRK